jgi:hypothetical protein
MKSLLLGCMAFAVIGLGAAEARANVYQIDFTLAPGGWATAPDGALYGLGNDPTINGSVTVDSNLSGGAAFRAISYTTGTRVWTLADIDGSQSGIFFSGPTFISFNFTMIEGGGFNFFYSNNTVSILDPSDNSRLVCNGCVNVTNVTDLSPPAVPEPASWAMLLAGFGSVGLMLRRRRPVAA